MNPPRIYDELLADATKGPVKLRQMRGDCFLEAKVPGKAYGQELFGDDYFAELDREADFELAARYWNHGPDMVAALRAAEERLTFDEGIALLGGFGPSTELAQIRAVLAALDGKDAT